MDYIYTLMTDRSPSDKAGRQGHFSGSGLGMALPRVSTNSLAGLVEEVAAPPYDGKANLPHLADSLQLAINELFPSLKLFSSYDSLSSKAETSG